MAQTNQQSGLMDILSGDKAFKFEIGVDFQSIAYLIGGALAVGILLILISKKVIK